MMVYYKMIDADGFVSVSTVNAETGGNSTQAEHDEISAMYRAAEPGYGVIETAAGFAYAKRPEEPEEEELTADEIVAAIQEAMS